MIFPRRCDTCRRYREQLKTERDKYEKLLAEKDNQLEEAFKIINRQNIEIYYLYHQPTDEWLHKTQDKGAVFRAWSDAKKYLKQFKESE